MGFRESVKRFNEATKKKLSCCHGCSRKWLFFMNGIIMLSGIILLSLSIFNSLTSGDVINAIGEFGILGTIVSGGILILVATLGCCGVIYKKKWILVIYLFASFIVAGIFMATGIFLTFLVRDLNNVDGAQSQTLAGKVEGRLNDFLIAVFNECCESAFPDDIERLLGCSDPLANQEACFTFEGDYEAALERVKNTGLCNTLENIEVDGFPVVGDPNVGGCAGGDGVLFKAVFTELVEDTLIPVGASFLALSSLMLITLITTYVLLCANQDNKEYFEQTDVKANDLTYGNMNGKGLYQVSPEYNPSMKAPKTAEKYNMDDVYGTVPGTQNPKYKGYLGKNQIGF